jgi:hypothetical protein
MNPTAGDVHVNAPLTNISIAYMQEAVNFIADKVFPTVPVQKQSDRYFLYPKGDWFRSEAQLRAPGTESAGSGYNIDNTPTYYAGVDAVHKDVDDQIRANADAPINFDRDATQWVTQQLMIRREKNWVANYFKTGVWTDLTGVAAAPVANQFLRWDDANSTPVEDITGAAVTMQQSTGYKPNTLVLNPFVYNALKNNADIIDRIKYTQRGVVTADILASLFDVERVMTIGAVENTAAMGATDAISFIAQIKGAMLVYANPRPSLLTPSAGYSFAWTGYFGAGGNGQRIKRFRMEQLSSDRIEGELAVDHKLVAADLGVFFNTAIS